MTEEQKYFRMMGIDYGFPDCCIESFCNGRTYATLSPAEKKQYLSSEFWGKGFIPCAECATRDFRDVLREIDKRRNNKYDTFMPDVIR